VFPTTQPVVSESSQKDKQLRYSNNLPERPGNEAPNKERDEFSK
jgi:hypothetical protein